MAEVRIDDHTDEYMSYIEEALERALEAIGAHIEGEAKEEISNSPKRIDTGLLRNSITYALDGESTHISSYSGDNPSRYGGKDVPSGSYSGSAPKESKGRSVIIGSNVEYALYIHEGTSKIKSPNRFLKNAVDRNRDQIDRIFKDAMG